MSVYTCTGHHLPQQLLFTQRSAQARFCFHISKLVVTSKTGMNESFLSLIYLHALEILVQQCVARHDVHGFPLCYEQQMFHYVCLVFLSFKGNFLPSIIKGFLYLSTISRNDRQTQQKTQSLLRSAQPGSQMLGVRQYPRSQTFKATVI